MADPVPQNLKIARVLASRDVDAFAELISESQASMRTFLVRLCRDYDLADDLAQETFLTAYLKLATYKGTGSFEGWLFRIAYNRFLQHTRDVSRKREVLSQYHELLQTDAARYESVTDIQLELEQALSMLNHEEAAAITLCHSFGCSHAEVAAILGSPLGTVKSQIRRGKEKLQQLLAERSQSDENGQERQSSGMEQWHEAQPESKATEKQSKQDSQQRLEKLKSRMKQFKVAL